MISTSVLAWLVQPVKEGFDLDWQPQVLQLLSQGRINTSPVKPCLGFQSPAFLCVQTCKLLETRTCDTLWFLSRNSCSILNWLIKIQESKLLPDRPELLLSLGLLRFCPSRFNNPFQIPRVQDSALLPCPAREPLQVLESTKKTESAQKCQVELGILHPIPTIGKLDLL